LLFLAAKVIAYTLFGFLLGALGSVFQLTPMLRAILLIAIGVFMVGNALRMFNVHPFFRYFVIEPPKVITRSIRRTAKDDSWFAPLFLGAMTIFIPCGVTQAMMAVAIASGDPIQGAMLMFAFTLGTTPVFFAVAYLATQIGSRWEKWFMRFVAVVILILGLISIDSGMTLLGSRYTFSNLIQSSRAAEVQPTQTTDGEVAQVAEGDLVLSARNDGYFPYHLQAKAGEALVLNVVTDNTQSCARAFVIPDLNVQVLLPASGTTPIDIPPQSAGTLMQFTCSMGMYTGVIEFVQ
jgi:sulfite exporter TauE/SafE